MKTCLSCKHWKSPHGGFWQEELFGLCEKLNTQLESAGVEGVVEGVTLVQSHHDDFHFATGKDFGCIYHQRKNK